MRLETQLLIRRSPDEVWEWWLGDVSIVPQWVAHFQLRLRYLMLAPLFYSMTSAIRRDLESLKSAIENRSPSTASANPGSPP